MNRIINNVFSDINISISSCKKDLWCNEVEVKDCFEKLNRVTFALNMGLDKDNF